MFENEKTNNAPKEIELIAGEKWSAVMDKMNKNAIVIATPYLFVSETI